MTKNKTPSNDKSKPAEIKIDVVNPPLRGRDFRDGGQSHVAAPEEG